MNNLSNREKQVLTLIAYEHSVHEIANELYISEHTAHTHKKNLFRKLEVKNIAGVVRRGFELGLLTATKSSSTDIPRSIGFQLVQRAVSIMLLVMLFIIPDTGLLAQINDEANVISKTTVTYDCNTPNATVTFPLNGDGICPSAPLLRWMKVYSINADGSETLVAKVSADNEFDNLMHEETCMETLVTYPAGLAADEPFCRYIDICDVGAVVDSDILAYNDVEVTNGSVAERYLKLIVPSSTGILRLVGDYDFGYDGFQIDNGFDVDFQRQDPFPGIDCPGYETPEFDFSPNIFNVSVSSLPFPICDDVSGVTTTSALAALQACESEYLWTTKGQVYSYRVNITHIFQQFGGTIRISYLTDAGTPQEKDSLLSSTFLSSFSSTVTESIPISYIPVKGSLGDIIRIRIIEANQAEHNIYIPVAVEGIIDDRVPILGNFLTPKIPYLILHDPPGDNSYSSFVQSDKVCRSETTTFTQSDSKGFSATVQGGFEVSAEFLGVGVNFQSTVAVTGSLKITNEVSNGFEERTCVEITSEIQTGKLESEIGTSQDLFIGAGTRWKYGVYDQVIIENCALSIQQGLVYSPDATSATEFKLTEKGIQQDLKLQENIVNDLSKSLLEREQAYNQIQVWQQILDQNQKNRENADYPMNFTQDPGAADNRTFSSSLTEVSNISYNAALEAGVDVESTFLVAGNGFYGGPQFSFNKTRSGSVTDEQGTTREFSYFTLDDDDQLDVEVGTDPDYGTPMFRLSDNASTSCPYEGGERKDRPRIFIQKGVYECPYFTRDNILMDEDTVMVTICNDHPTETRFFDAMVSGNTNNLELKINGTSLFNAQNIAPLGSIAANSCKTFLLSITKAPLINSYNNIFLRVYPQCLSVFLPELPLEQRIAEENDSLVINLTFGGPGNYPPDMDCDGVPDNLDPCPNMTSEGDDDCDGFVNAVDACPLDPTNSDADLDGFLDCIDLCPNQLDGSLDFNRNKSGPYDNMADHVVVPHDPRLNLPQRDFTIEAWVKPTDDFFKTIASKGDGSNIFQTVFAFMIWERNEANGANGANGQLALLVGGQWQFSDNQVPLNVWSHVAVTYNAEEQRALFHIDGQFSGERIYSFAPYLADSQPMLIGRLGTTSASGLLYGFKGAMDELIIWDRVLEQEEIVLTMTNSLGGNENNLLAYYRFDQHPPCAPGGTTTLMDSGANSFDGTLTNFDLGTNTNGLNNPCLSNWSEGRNADVNQDGLGDICSIDGNLLQDSDNDGYSDLIDLCPNTVDAALHFTGTNWAETVSSPSIVGSNFAFSAWIYPTSNDFATIISQGNGSNAQTAFILSKVSDNGSVFPQKDRNKIGLYLANGSIAEWKLSNTPIELYEWTHIAVNVSGSSVSFYINGQQDGTQTYSFSNYYNTNVGNLFIGRQGQACNCNYFSGAMDDISIWSKNLNIEEIKALYHNKIAVDATSLIAAYNFNQGSPCQNNIANNLLWDISTTGSNFICNLFNFNLGSNSCTGNWTRARNTDSDGDGIGDVCEPSTFACASTAGTGGPGPDNDYLEDCLDFCPTNTETSLLFDGINDFVFVNHDGRFNLADGNFTIQLWIKPALLFQDVSLINKGHGLTNSTIYNLLIKGDEVPQLKHKLGLNMSGEWVFSNSRIEANEWTHISVTFDRNSRTVRFYINGELDSQPRILSATNPLYNADTGELRFGSDRSGTTGKYQGSMEDVIIWDKTLSADEILRTMVAPLNGNEFNLVAYYKFNDGIPYGTNFANNTLIDNGPNALDGTLQDFTLVGTLSNWGPGRNIDSDGDGVGDGCDDGLPCPPNYAGINALDNSLLFSNNYETQGIIETSQMINSPINVIYNSATSVDLLPGFEVNQAVLEVKNDGCSQN